MRGDQWVMLVDGAGQISW